MPTFHIHIGGQVQGVGFRPFVHRLALSMCVHGRVSNGLDGIHIFINGDRVFADLFYKNLIKMAPINARILWHSMVPAAQKNFKSFEIVDSAREGKSNLFITPDLGLCENCRKELHDSTNRRNDYPFITCTDCGPRFSVISNLPYDRELTTMNEFSMCELCLEEYNNPLNRRYFSQTNSCTACGIHLSFLKLSTYESEFTARENSFSVSKKSIRFIEITNDPKKCIHLVVNTLEDGQILAIKSIGGYLLICDATNSSAIATLRLRKHRPSKPFAVMYPNLEMLKKDAFLSMEEESSFLSVRSPIVLCRLRDQPLSGIDSEGIVPHLDNIGALQPYSPLFELILSKWQKPIVVTSGNLSGSPILFEDKKAIKSLENIADFILTNDRKILIPQDDSIVQFSPENKQPIILRRSRGYAPTYIHQSFPEWIGTYLAMGSDIKNTFSLQHEGNTYVSQYLGDLENFDSQENYEKTFRHYLSLFDAHPQQFVVDKHPAFFSSEKGRELAKTQQLPVIEIQHHIAHFAAVLVENKLLFDYEPTLGVIWDGIGWGDDGNIWGGEFFLFENGKFERMVHFHYFPHLLGNKMSKEPRLSAFALSAGIPSAETVLRSYFTRQEWTVYSKILIKEGGLKSSSVGRLFDGVAALLGLQLKSFFEGEAALKLEGLARRYQAGFLRKKDSERHLLEDYFMEVYFGETIDFQGVLTAIIFDLRTGVDKCYIAFKFHQTLARIVGKVATLSSVRRVAFSGGVFQNALLVDLIINELMGKYEVFFHKELSPNDECISFGQLAYLFLKQKGRS